LESIKKISSRFLAFLDVQPSLLGTLPKTFRRKYFIKKFKTLFSGQFNQNFKLKKYFFDLNYRSVIIDFNLAEIFGIYLIFY